MRYGITDIDVTAANVVFLNSNANDFSGQRPSVVVSGTFIIPGSTGKAGISRITDNNLPEGDKFRPDEENNWPTCEDRQFTIDFLTGSICYCNYHKWRCNDDPARAAAPLD